MMTGESGGPTRVWLRALVAIALMVTTAVLTACGAGGGNASGASSSTTSQAGEVVARVGATPITRAEVNHWMSTLAGGDYYEVSFGDTVPEGLVSDPPRYSVCVAHLEGAAAKAPLKGNQPSSVELLTKCRELHQALRLQAIALLVDVEWILGLAAEEGISASAKEVLAAYNRSTAERFANRSALSRNQVARRISVSDELLLFRKNVLASKLIAKLKSQGGVASISRLEARWAPKIDCRPGYVVEHCKQFHSTPPPSPSQPSAAVLLEQVNGLATGHCRDTPNCGKQ
jgi:hypothetical protein